MMNFSRCLSINKCLKTLNSAHMHMRHSKPPIISVAGIKHHITAPSLLQNGLLPRSLLFHTKQSHKQDTEKTFFEKISKEMKIALGLGTVLASYLIYNDLTGADRSSNRNFAKSQNAGESPFLLERPPQHAVARSIVNPKDPSNLKLTLYQYQTCPFCCKMRAFLDYYGFSYDVVEVNSVTRKQTSWTKYRKVPFLVVELYGPESDEGVVLQLKDSTAIMSCLSSVLRNPRESLLNIVDSYPTYYDEDEKLQFTNKYSIMYGEENTAQPKYKHIDSERKWRQWVDDVFIHTLSPNVYRTPTESLQAFNWFSEVGDWERLFPMWERLLVVYLGAAVMWVIGKRLKKRHNLEDEPRDSLYKEAGTWMNGLKVTGGPFMGGSEPNLADVSMYGVLTAIEGCDAFQEMMDNTKIGVWFYEMKRRVISRAGEQALIARCAVR